MLTGELDFYVTHLVLTRKTLGKGMYPKALSKLCLWVEDLGEMYNRENTLAYYNKA